jgi:hypothetical protein
MERIILRRAFKMPPSSVLKMERIILRRAFKMPPSSVLKMEAVCFLREAGICPNVHTALQPIRPESTYLNKNDFVLWSYLVCKASLNDKNGICTGNKLHGVDSILKNKSGLRSARQEIPPFYRT